MKKLILLLLCLVTILCGCGEKFPETALDGAAWDKNWIMLGSTMGVEDPGNGLKLVDNNLALATDDTYLATWASGEPATFVNENGEDTDLYEAQLYLLLLSCKDQPSAQAAVDDWVVEEQTRYTVASTSTETYNGQEYTVLSYETRSETNPYDRGVVAFAVFENYAVTAELSCLADYTGDEAAILADFLNGCHYSADIAN